MNLMNASPMEVPDHVSGTDNIHRKGCSYPNQEIYHRIVTAKLTMDHEYGSKLTLDYLASKACLSKFHFLRVFKTIYGVTPLQYLTEIRIERAKTLMGQGLSLSESCWLVGFESRTTFMGLLKRNTGVTSRSLRLQFLAAPAPFLPGCLSRKRIENHGGS